MIEMKDSAGYPVKESHSVSGRAPDPGLLPCPFCSADAINWFNNFTVGCSKCPCSLHIMGGPNESAIAAWNRRAPPVGADATRARELADFLADLATQLRDDERGRLNESAALLRRLAPAPARPVTLDDQERMEQAAARGDGVPVRPEDATRAQELADAVAEFLTVDGGEGGYSDDATRYYAARRKMRDALRRLAGTP